MHGAPHSALAPNPSHPPSLSRLPPIPPTSPPPRRPHHLVSVPGTVIRTGQRKVLVVRQAYRCAKCDAAFAVRRDVEQRDALPKPSRCLVRTPSPLILVRPPLDSLYQSCFYSKS